MTVVTGKGYNEINVGDTFGAAVTVTDAVAVADAVVATLDPVRVRYDELIKDRAELDRIFKTGAEQAQATAYRTLSKVNRKVGFVERPR